MYIYTYYSITDINFGGLGYSSDLLERIWNLKENIKNVDNNCLHTFSGQLLEFERIKKIEELKEIVTDDNRVFHILGKICKENRKDYWLHIFGIGMFLVGIVCIILGVICALKVDISEMIATLGIVLVLVGVYISVLFRFNSKKIISDDELQYLNFVLEEKTLILEGILTIAPKGKQCIIEENNVLKSVGKAYKETKIECEKFCYKKIEDWEGICYPRYQVVWSVRYIK